MENKNPRYSRVNRKKTRNRSNQLLNIMIGLVILLILIVGASIIIGNNDDDKKESASKSEEVEEAGSSEDESQIEEDDSESSDDGNGSVDSGKDGGSSEQSTETDGSDNNDEEAAAEEEESGTVSIVPDDDGIIVETIIDKSWQPIGTNQTGVHESKYVESVDWDEKKKAIAYAVGHPEEALIYWKIKNGGSPQKSIGIISTRDKSEKYRVFIEWVDEKGWKPVQMDILNTLDFEY